jgi:transposase
LGTFPNRAESIRKLVNKLGPVKQVRACYEAGPTGYVLYWQLTALGVDCQVIAPSLVPTKAGDRVKTDRRDAEKLARCHRAGELTAVFVPDAEIEALRDLLRAREAAKKDQLRARHRLGKFLLRHGKRPDKTMKSWTQKYLDWIKANVKFAQPALEATLEDYLAEVKHVAERIQKLEKAIGEAVAKARPEIREVVAALQALRGVGPVTAATVVAELGSLERFESPRQLMGHAGMVPREHSSGSKVKRGGITKTGNAHLRRVIVEAAWAYQHRPWVGGFLKKRQAGLSQEVIDIGWKAQQRLCKRYQKLSNAGKNKPQVVTAVGRELLGFIWAIAVHVERKQRTNRTAA